MVHAPHDKGVVTDDRRKPLVAQAKRGEVMDFVTQSWNSLEAVSRVEDYKVFLNPEMIAEFSDATKLTSAKKKVIDAWRDGGLLGNEAIQGKFKSYFNYDDYFDEIQFEQMLKDNDNWFKKIFIENLD